MKMSSQAQRWILLGSRTISLVVFFYAQFKAVATYRQLSQCVAQAEELGALKPCQSYPDSIEGYVYLLIGSVLVLVIASHLLDARKARGT